MYLEMLILALCSTNLMIERTLHMFCNVVREGKNRLVRARKRGLWGGGGLQRVEAGFLGASRVSLGATSVRQAQVLSRDLTTCDWNKNITFVVRSCTLEHCSSPVRGKLANAL